MSIFDDAFKSAVSAPFEGNYQFRQSNGDLVDVVGIFTADQVLEKINGANVKKTMYTLEFGMEYLDQLDIVVNSIFVIEGNHYRVTKTPFVDEIGWVTTELQKTAAE